MAGCQTFSLVPALRRMFILVAAVISFLPQLHAQLSGTYSVGSGQTYASFTAAVTALTTSGVSGPVTFNVISGTYNEQITIPAITGASSVNTITFQSQSGTPSDVTLLFAPTAGNNYVVLINGADFIAFKNMTVAVQGAGSYGVVFRFTGDADDNTLSGNIITGINIATSSGNYCDIIADNQAVDNLTIDDNVITNGSYGVFLVGVNTTVRSSGTKVTNNTMSNFGYSGVYLHSQNSPMVTGNTITNAASRGIEMYYCQNDILVESNNVTGIGNYGFLLQYSNGGTGFPPQGLIANNMFQSGANGAGMYLFQNTNQFVYNNSVNITGGASYAYYGYNNAASVSLLNNNLANSAGGYAGYLYSSSEAMDYNNLFTTGNFLGRVVNTEYTDLAAWRAGSGQDANSVSYYPDYFSASDLHTGSGWLNAKGLPVVEVTDDIDGNARDGSTPDIGADEYTPTVQPPLSGAYNLGAAQTYTTFRAAAAALMSRGVSGPVTFNVLGATYNEHFVLYTIPGADETNTVTFQSSTNVTSSVTLVFNAAAPESNYVVQLVNTDFVKFHKITLRGNNNVGASYSSVFVLRGGVDNFTLDSCNVFGYSSASTSLNFALVNADGLRGSNATFTGNTFNTGSYGIYWDSYANANPTPGTLVSGNTFLTQAYTGIYLRYHDRPVVTANTVTNPGSRGIEVYYSHNDLAITKNKVTGAGSYGLILQYSNGGSGFPPQGLIANNFIQAGANASGIYLFQCTNQFLYNNSVNMTGGASQAYYGYNNAASVSLLNNNLANSGGGYATYLYSSSETIDYSNLFTTGNFVGRLVNTEYTDLAAWRSASGRDANGVSYYPSFTSATNLHTGSPWLNAKGLSVAEVFDDVDGEARDGSTPDIGADEYTPTVQPPLSGPYNIGAGQTFTNFRNAAAALMSRGVGGPVTFNVMSATYNEHFILYTIPGADETNTVTFQSNTNVTSAVTLIFNAAAPESNYVVQLINTDFVKFHKITLRGNNNVGASYSSVFVLRGGVDNFILDSCNVFGYSGASSSLNYALVHADGIRGSNPTFTGNTFNSGSYGIYWDGYSNVMPTPGTVAIGNTFLSMAYTGIYLRYHDRPLVSENTVTNPGSRGIEVYYSHNDLAITKNKVTGAGSYGLILQYSNGGSGFPPQGLIANNFIQAGANASGIYLFQCTNQFVYNNSVNMTGGASQGYYGYNNAASVSLLNNNLSNLGGGYGAYLYSSSEAMDYNNLFTIGNFVGRIVNTELADLAAWQSTSGKDANSVSYYPAFVSATNLHTGSHWLNAKGLTVPEVFDDIDGEARDGATPDIGADEYVPDILQTPLAGTYTIGTSAGSRTTSGAADFTTFDAAAAALTARGISDAVVFDVQPGTYQESVVFYPIAGASGPNTVTFQSQNGNAASTVLSSLTTVESSYVALFYGTDNVTFRNMTFRSNTNVGAQYGIVFYLWGNVDNFEVDHCIVTGIPTANSSANHSLVYSSNAFTRGIRLTNNIFNDGGYAVYLDGFNQSILCTGTEIRDNTFLNPDYAGAFLRYHDAPKLTGNTVINADSRGFELQYCMNGLEVTKNKIITDGTSVAGIYIQYCTGTVLDPGVIANNFVSCTGSSSSGINIYGSNTQRILFNSVNMTSSSSQALYAYSGSSNTNNYLNNNFANHGGGYSVYVYSPEGVGASNYNNHYSNGATLAYWAGARTTLGDLQSASTKETNSRSVLPGYYSSTNLHSISPPLDSAGTQNNLVSDDIDGEPRDPNKPDIGADEFSVIINVSTPTPGGWNMISLPLVVANNLKTTLFPAATSNAFAYEPPAGYSVKDTIRTMVGYWLKYPSALTVNITGAPNLRDSAITRAGWNLIGAVAVPIPRTAVVQDPPLNVASNYFEYVPGAGYVIADTLKPGRAFWVKTSVAGKLTLDVTSVLPKPLASEQEEDLLSAVRGLNELVFQPEAEGSQAARLYFGLSRENGPDMERFSLPPSPPAGAADVRFASDRYVELLASGQTGEIPITVQGEGASFRLSWSMREELGFSYVLIERTGAAITRQQALRGTGSMAVTSGKRYAIRLQELPTAFALLQNYPNPFNPTTSLRFDLPEASSVTLKVYTMLGQELSVPLDNVGMERGSHVVDLDARGWASGTYLYRLQAVDAQGRSMSAVRKMVLMK